MTEFSQLLQRAKTRDRYWVEKAIVEFTEELVQRMGHLQVTKSELAARLGKNPSFVTKLLSGNNNFTLETMVKLARILDTELRVHLQPDGTISEWINILKEEPIRNFPQTSSAWGMHSFEKVLDFPVIDQPNELLTFAA